MRATRRWRSGLPHAKAAPGIVGVNIGANKDSADRIGDYERGVARFAPSPAISRSTSPRRTRRACATCRRANSLGELLVARHCRARRCGSPEQRRVPIFLKIAPDLAEAELDDIAAEVAGQCGRRRHRLQHHAIARPRLQRATPCARNRRPLGKAAVRALDDRAGEDAEAARPDVPIIGVGGVDSAETALEKIRAGADLVQLYTGMIYAGPALPGRILAGMIALCRREGTASRSRAARQPARSLGGETA